MLVIVYVFSDFVVYACVMYVFNDFVVYACDSERSSVWVWSGLIDRSIYVCFDKSVFLC